MLGVTTVETVGDRTHVLRVLVDVGVEQQQRDAANVGHPQGDGDLTALGEGDGDLELLTLVIGDGDNRQVGRVVVLVLLLLPTIGAQGLGEVTVGVEQADADQGNAEVGGGLHMVAGEHAEATRVDREAGVDAEFHGEVGGDGGVAALGLGAGLLVPQRGRQVLAEVLGFVVDASQVLVITGELTQTGGGCLMQHLLGVFPELGPQFRVDVPEQLFGFLTPRPAQIVREPNQGFELGGELIAEFHCAY